MTALQSLVMGAIQGATEFIPVSSTAHLILFPWVFGWVAGGQAHDVSLHIGTLLALLVYFGKDWTELLTRKERGPELWRVAVGCLPAGVVGLSYSDFFSQFNEPDKFPQGPLFIAGFLLCGSCAMALAEYVGHRERELGQISLVDAFVIGCFQALALFPGFSRSGITISGAMYLGMTREAAARYSFLLSAPIIAGACAKGMIDLWKQGHLGGEHLHDVLLGIIASGVVGFLCIAFLMSYLKRRTLSFFIWYRVVLGFAILAIFGLKQR